MPDQILLTFDDSVFSDPITDIQVNSGEKLFFDLPRQMDAKTAKQLTETLHVVSDSANSSATVTIVVNIVLGISLKFVWGLINILQLIVFFKEWNA